MDPFVADPIEQDSDRRSNMLTRFAPQMHRLRGQKIPMFFFSSCFVVVGGYSWGVYWFLVVSEVISSNFRLRGGDPQES